MKDSLKKQRSNWRPFEEARNYVHKLELKSTSEWRQWVKSSHKPEDIPSNPDKAYEGKGWKGFGDWLGTGVTATKYRRYRSFKEARAYAQSLGLKNQKEWQNWARSNKRPDDIPASPLSVYQDEGWTSWGDWLGTGRVSSNHRSYRSFEEARDYVQSLKFSSTTAWQKWVRSEAKPGDIPTNPHRVYKNKGWLNWGDWFGTDTLPFEEARAYIHHQGLKSKNEWQKWVRSEAKPANIPANPATVYKNKGWVNWGDWLGTGTIAAHNQTYLPFEEARNFACTLGFKSNVEWKKWAKTDARPENIPASPSMVYQNKGWTDWGDLLGNTRWTIAAIRRFVNSLINYLEAFTPSELYLLFQQRGLLQSEGKGKSFVKALATGRFPKEEIEKFSNNEPSIVDNFLQDNDLTLEAVETSNSNNIVKKQLNPRENELDDEIGNTVDPSEDNFNLPVVQTREVLLSLDHNIVSSADEEAVEFLIASAKAKIWKHAFRHETAAITQAESYTGDNYAERVKTEFLDEYHRAKNLKIPTGYAFQINGKLTPPNLMQRLIAVRVRDQKRVGNWSGTGAGKTLSAVLASRVINAHLTVICCPNSVVDGWKKAILDIFPDSIVTTKTFTPNWEKLNPFPTREGGVFLPSPQRRGVGGEVNHYLILNYEMFQQPNSPDWVRSLVNNEQIDFIVIDEIHYTKQRQVEDMSRRKQLVSALITAAAERNPDLHVIGMSATPVINNLQEGKSLVEMVTGVAHNELEIRPTVPNCMKLHQRLVTLGIRWMPEYNLEYEQVEIPVDCGDFIDQIRALGNNGTPLQLEKILTLARLPIIRSHIQPKTLIYTHYIQGIDRLLRDALENDGWNVGFYTGEDKSGLDGFLNGKIDVLIGSSAIGTGVDGLQQVCNQLIINVLPWTHAEFEQLKGRIYRQGQIRDKVRMVIPLTHATVNSQRWSWCDSKMQRLRFKKSIADAAVDGVVPEGHLRTPAQAYQDVMAWLERLETGQLEVIARPKIVVPIPDSDPADVQRRLRRYGDFSTMNRLWNQTRSAITHQRLQANPEEWAQYHTLYQESRKDWTVIPYEEMIRWCQKYSGYNIGDFGCGEAKLAEAVSDRHTVYSFDHVAINPQVIACDMAHVPLEDEELDVAIFSLSLMGSNFTDYLREAYRTLKLDAQLHIIEATSRFNDLRQFQSDLEALGFAVISIRDQWKFTYIHARKTARPPQEKVELQF